MTKPSCLSHFSTSTESAHFFDRHVLICSTRYISNIEMTGATIKYVPLQPPKHGAEKTSSAAEWTLDMDLFVKAVTPKTRMLVRFYLYFESSMC